MTATVFGALMIVIMLLAGYYILTSFALMLVLKKAGHPRPWAGWIPVYRDWALLEIGRQHGAWALLTLAVYSSQIPEATVRRLQAGPGGSVLMPIASSIVLASTVIYVVVFIFALINIHKGFQKSPLGWTLFAFILQPLWECVLGFSSTKPFDAKRQDGPYFAGARRLPPEEMPPAPAPSTAVRSDEPAVPAQPYILTPPAQPPRYGRYVPPAGGARPDWMGQEPTDHDSSATSADVADADAPGADVAGPGADTTGRGTDSAHTGK